MSDYTTVEEVELSIEQAQEKIKLRDMAMKLASNREFKKLIIDGYFKDEAARLAGVSGDPNTLNVRDEIFDQMKSISYFRQFMQKYVREGDMAEQELQDHYEVLNEMEQMDGAET